MNMFGVLAAGRLVQTDFVEVDMTHCVCSLASADSINHLVVFLTGQQAFPDGLAGAVYFSFPPPGEPPSWQYLGYISNDKPSAIFRITKWKPTSDLVQNGIFGNAVVLAEKTAQIGISVEPFDQVKSMTPADGSSSTAAPTDAFLEFGKKMLENFVDFASSFALQPSTTPMNANETYVPLSIVQKWYDNFTRRMGVNPYFWRT